MRQLFRTWQLVVALSLALAMSLSAMPSLAEKLVVGHEWTSSLGVKFVPAGTRGVLFGVWDVRVKDFKAFVDATGYQPVGYRWPKPAFTQTENDPVVNVTWDDAKAFCAWLTKIERAEGKLGPHQRYRLPTDAEWSVAVGLKEKSRGTPDSKDGKIKGIYPWGTQWPPPSGTGNYDESLTHDGYAGTSPVGSFPPNSYGLYDMGGDVAQWCEDFLGGEYGMGRRVLRGAGWNANTSDWILLSGRGAAPPNFGNTSNGFRVVVVTG